MDRDKDRDPYKSKYMEKVHFFYYFQAAWGMHTRITSVYLWLVWTMCFTSELCNGLAARITLKKICCYCDESGNGAFLAGSPVWYCMWCQRLVHVNCHSSLAKETGDICDLGPLKRLILSPLCVKELHWTGAGILSSIYLSQMGLMNRLPLSERQLFRFIVKGTKG